MNSLLLLFSLSFVCNIVYSSIPFVINPNCDLSQCKEINHPALYYTNHVIDDNAIHIIYSSLDELTISIFQTSKGDNPIFNYTALFAKNYPGAIQFIGTKPVNSFSLILRRLIQFNDKDDNGKMDDSEVIRSFFLSDLKTNNVTFQTTNTTQPTFQFPLETLDGLLTIDVVYPGETMRDSKFPKLRTLSESFFLDIALQVNKFSLPNTRFAFELLLISHGIDGYKIFPSSFIDDHYTPGIFTVYQMRTLSTSYPLSMLWKPVVYQSEDRTIEQNTLMHIYDITNSFIADPKIDQGVSYSILPFPNISAFNISLGQANDGFFIKTNYTFIQFTAGLDLLEPDSTKGFVTIALVVSFALPVVVGLIALIFVLKRRFSQPSSIDYNSM